MLIFLFVLFVFRSGGFSFRSVEISFRRASLITVTFRLARETNPPARLSELRCRRQCRSAKATVADNSPWPGFSLARSSTLLLSARKSIHDRLPNARTAMATLLSLAPGCTRADRYPLPSPPLVGWSFHPSYSRTAAGENLLLRAGGGCGEVRGRVDFRSAQ